MSEKTTTALTVGAIASRLGRPVHKVAYVINTRGIEPAFRAGTLRIFTEADVKHIASELKRMDAERYPNNQ